MQRGRGGRDPFFGGFGDPFGGFGDPFGGLGGIGGFGNHRSLVSNFFGGRDPFDDPFFRQPFGGMFESHFFGSNGSPFADMGPSGFIEHQLPEPKKAKGPIIEELNSDDEKEEADKDKKENPRKHGRSIKDPDDEAEERKGKHLQYRGSHTRSSGMEQQPQTRSFTFQSSSVTYGGANGAYYTSSKTKRTGSDGVSFEESKEADSSTRQAIHSVSRGFHNKGHSLARKLNSDGKVDTMQTLHNLHEDELDGFEEAWKGSGRQFLPGWNGDLSGMRAGASGQNAEGGRGGWALPSTEHVKQMENQAQNARYRPGYSQMQNSGGMKSLSGYKDNGKNSRGRARE